MKNEIIKGYNNGLSANKISEINNVSEKFVRACLKEANVIFREKKQNLPKFSDEQMQIIIALYKAGADTKELAEVFNCAQRTIYKRLEICGIVMRGRSEALKLAALKRRLP